MKTTALLTLTLFATALCAHADFSYTTTRKTTGGVMGAMAGANGNGTTKNSFKGQKMKVEDGDTATILDFDAQTITTINNRAKTVSVRKFSDVAANQGGFNAKIEVKETGQKKTINGYSASELVMTMDVDSPSTAQMGKMQMEMDMWLSSDVPGAGELRAFYQRNMGRFPWAALSGGAGNPTMQASMAELQRKIAEMNGVPVEEVVKLKMAGGAAAPTMPQMTPDQAAKMKDAMAKLQAMQNQGGPAAAAAAQAMARMGNIPGAGGPAPAAGSGSMLEMTMDSSDFSTSSIPESTFAIPAGYQKADK
jgi:Domain of unknown function (DUF4412)